VLATLGALDLEQSSATDLNQSLLGCPHGAHGAIVCATLPSLSVPVRGVRAVQAHKADSAWIPSRVRLLDMQSGVMAALN
jgi:hypothetical protein